MRRLSLIALFVLPLTALADNEPPSITPLAVDVPDTGQPLVIEADIRDPSGIFQPQIYWRVAGKEAFAAAAMQQVDGARYRVELPLAPETKSVEYLFEAFDNHGNGPARVGSRETPLVVKLEKKQAAPPPPVVMPLLDPPNRTPAWVALGVGGAGLVAGTVFGVLANSAHGSFLETHHPVDRVAFAGDTRTRALVADVSFGLGLVGVGVGAFLLLNAQSAADDLFAVAPSLDGVVLSGAF